MEQGISDYMRPIDLHAVPASIAVREEEEATGLLPIVKDRENPQVIQQKINVQW